MTNRSKTGKKTNSDTPSWITVIYCLFTLLYTVFITHHFGEFGSHHAGESANHHAGEFGGHHAGEFGGHYAGEIGGHHSEGAGSYRAGHFGGHEGADWWYFLKFLTIGSYCFFILQGVIQRSKNWGVLLLLPVGILMATIVAGYILVWIIRLGGGDLLDHEKADMILASLIFLTFSYFALRLIGVGKSGGRK